MAKAEKFTPPPPQEQIRIELSEVEAKSLFTLLDDGVDSTTLNRLSLRELHTALRDAGVRADFNVTFDYMAELD